MSVAVMVFSALTEVPCSVLTLQRTFVNFPVDLLGDSAVKNHG